MKTKKRLPIPQHEFGFTAGTFSLIRDIAVDGWRIAGELKASEQARHLTEAAQPEMALASRLPSKSAAP